MNLIPNIQLFANSGDTEVYVKFIELSMETYLDKVKNGQIDNTAMYFVSTNNTSADFPVLLFKGQQMIGNSGLLYRHATNGFITSTNNNFITSTDLAGHITSISVTSGSITENSLEITYKLNQTTTYVYKDDGTGNLKNLATSAINGTVDYTTGNIEISSSSPLYAANSDSITLSNNFLINVINPIALSTNIRGVNGQTLFVIDEYNDVYGNSTYSTYLYYWKNEAIVQNGNVLVDGRWVNANLNLVTKLNLGDIEVTATNIQKLLNLLM